ncbi:DUF2586 family protein [Microscilla marina]|nr:DUF2586 family protein [Microscilla marina]
MSNLPDVSINYLDGQLGGAGFSNDGVAAMLLSGVAVPLSGDAGFDLGVVIGPFFGIKDVQKKGITAEYDTSNSLKVYAHCVDFYRQAGEGAELYLMLAPKTVTMAEMLDTAGNYAPDLLNQKQGNIKLLGVGRVPDVAYNASPTEELDPDVLAALANAQILINAQQTLHQPVQIIIEGRDFQGDASAVSNLRTQTANRVSVCLGWHDESYEGSWLGLVLGKVAGVPVQRSVGRVKDGDLGIQQAYIVTAATPKKTVEQYGQGNLNLLHQRGYIVPRSFANRAGYYLNGDPVAIALTTDYNSISRGRVADKVARIAYNVYVQELLDDFQLEQGKLPVAKVKAFEQDIKKALDLQMTNNGEVSSVTPLIDPDQDVIATAELKVKIDIEPVGMAQKITIDLGFVNPSS